MLSMFTGVDIVTITPASVLQPHKSNLPQPLLYPARTSLLASPKQIPRRTFAARFAAKEAGHQSTLRS